MFFKKWWEVGISRVRDILYEIRDGFLPIQAIIDELEEAKEEYDISCVKKQYEEMKNAIPTEWLNEIQRGGVKEGRIQVFFINKDKRMELKLGNVKMFYQVFMEGAFKKPNSNVMWLRHFNGLEEKDIW